MNQLCHKCQEHVDGLDDDCLADFLGRLVDELFEEVEGEEVEVEEGDSQNLSTDVPKSTTSNSSGKQ